MGERGWEEVVTNHDFLRNTATGPTWPQNRELTKLNRVLHLIICAKYRLQVYMDRVDDQSLVLSSPDRNNEIVNSI